MRQHSIHQIQRLLVLISFLVLLGIGFIVARALGFGLNSEDGIPAQRFVWAVFNRQVALISGHAGSDSGATCEDEDGTVRSKEADIVAEISKRVAKRLVQAGADVTILQEYDTRLEDLQADVLLSIHADSCIDVSGYKAARALNSVIPETDDRLVNCIDQFYPAATGLTIHSESITHNMTEYHAWHKINPNTPAAILEVGFLGGDQELLNNQPALVAKGISDSLLCFLTHAVTNSTSN